MSRVAKNPITIPDTASVTVDNNIVKDKMRIIDNNL